MHINKHSLNTLKLYVVLGLLIALILTAQFTVDTTEKEVKAGTRTLTCLMKDGERVIEPTKIKYVDDNGRWHFTNGHAGNCAVGDNNAN